jgi:hypothetical protein
MFKRNKQIESVGLRSLTDAEIEHVVGGVKMGPNGEGCTRPGRPPTKPVYIPPTGAAYFE